MSTLFINNSLLSMLNRCATETWVRWGRELVMQEQAGPGAREVGTVLHRAFETHFRGGYPGEVLTAFDQAWKDVVGDALPQQDRLHYANVALVLRHWLDAQALRPRDWCVQDIEKTFEVPLGMLNGEEVIYYGTPDMLIEWKGDLYVVDNKTTGSIDEDWAQSWQMSAQLQGYVWAYRQQGINVRGAFVNGLEVTKLPPWDGNMQKKCSTHKLKYEQCQAAHVRHQWVGPLWWSKERLAIWRRNAISMARTLYEMHKRIEEAQSRTDGQDLMGMWLAMTPMDGQFRWPGCNGGRGRPPCQYRSWCQANRPLAGLTQMMQHEEWRGPLKEVHVE